MLGNKGILRTSASSDLCILDNLVLCRLNCLFWALEKHPKWPKVHSLKLCELGIRSVFKIICKLRFMYFGPTGVLQAELPVLGP